MTMPIDIALIKHRKALDIWLVDCKRRMRLRFPRIEFDSNHWPIQTLYRTEQRDWYFTEPLAAFAEKDISYHEVLRCLVAEMVLAGTPKDIGYSISVFRLLALASPYRIFDLTLQDLRKIEADCLTACKENAASANRSSSNLSSLAMCVAQLSAKGVLPRLGYYFRPEVKAELGKIAKSHRGRLQTGKNDLLERRMEALNDAFNKMDDVKVDGTSVLTSLDRVAICASILSLCAPSRINEILCLSIDDHLTVEDYGQKAIGRLDAAHRAHQMLIVTMKGSKGAEWSPKPVLEFMIDAFHHCQDILKECGQRSRMLVEWYQKNPTTLYLPPELEYARGQAVSRKTLAKIIQLRESTPTEAQHSASKVCFSELKDKIFKGPNPAPHRINGTVSSWPTIDFLPWAAIEGLLLEKVHQAMADCRRVTISNHFEGDLAKMLFLFDREETPYLPYAVNYKVIKTRLKHTESNKKQIRPPTLFNKLNITMPVNGKIQYAEMDTHDPRRWLTTMALIHGEKLSDVLINKWANRCKLSQLKAYDFRNQENIANAAAMPEAAKLNELTDLSNGLATVEMLEDAFGLQTAIVTAHDAGIAMTSMDAISQAIENRPIAKSSRGIIIIYPQRFGVCFHQHHEKPCRNYSNDLVAACVTCDSAAYIKGHIPTNDETRKVAMQLLGSVVRHLENLAHTYNRNIADDSEALGEHMLVLIEKGLSKATLEQWAIHLIEEVHQINHLLKDRLLSRRLEQAFVTREVVKLLDDQSVKVGALIKYHNPTQHSEPLVELALDEHGGRAQVEFDERVLIANHPQFEPKALGLKDERHLIAVDDDSED